MTTRRLMAVAVTALGLLFAGAAAPALASAQEDSDRGVVLVLDTSGSMTEEDVDAAREAALDYVDAVPPDVLVGLVTFSTKPELVAPPATNRATLTNGLTGLGPGGNTALYDAVILGVAALDDLGDSGQRRLVVLTDGEDSVSDATLAATAELLVAENVAADFVAFRYDEADTAALEELASVSGGRVLTAEDAAQLSAAFAAIADSAPSPDDAGGVLGWWPDWSWQVWSLGGVAFAALLLMVLAIASAFSGGKTTKSPRTALEQIARYGPHREPAPAEGTQLSSVARAAVGWTENVLRARGWEERVAERLDLAAIKMRPGEWTLLRVCVGIAAAAVLILLGVPFLIGVPLGAVLGWAATLLVVNFRIGRRRKAFSEQLPDVLQLLAGSLRSGFSLAQALDTVVREDTQPTAGEFSRALAESRIGVEVEQGLDRVAERMASDDMRWVVMAIRIQREVGGNLAEVLLNTVSTMRERAQTRRQVRALSAEGRLSAYVLIALPIGIGTFFFWSNPDYMRPLHTTSVGLMLMAGALVFTILGMFWMSRLIKVEV